MSELEKLRAQVEKHDAEIQAIMDMTVELFTITILGHVSQSKNSHAESFLMALSNGAKDKGDAPHTGESLQMEVLNRVREKMKSA